MKKQQQLNSNKKKPLELSLKMGFQIIYSSHSYCEISAVF